MNRKNVCGILKILSLVNSKSNISKPYPEKPIQDDIDIEIINMDKVNNIVLDNKKL